MLILTRRIGENLVIKAGDAIIKVYNQGVKGQQVQIGIEAPNDVTVDRQEIYDRKQKGWEHYDGK